MWSVALFRLKRNIVYSDAEVLENSNIKAYVSLRKKTKTGEERSTL